MPHLYWLMLFLLVLLHFVLAWTLAMLRVSPARLYVSAFKYCALSLCLPLVDVVVSRSAVMTVGMEIR